MRMFMMRQFFFFPARLSSYEAVEEPSAN